MQHVFVDLQEHVRVCVCGGRGKVRAGGRVGSGGGGGECDACGSIPLPPLVPRVWEEQEQLGEEERLEGGGRRRAGQQQQREGGRPGRRRRGRRQHQQQRLAELEQEGRRDQTAPPPPPPVVLEDQQDQHEQQQDDQAPVPIQVEAIDAEFEALGDVNVNAQGANVRGPAPPQEVRRMTALAQRGVVVVDGRAGRSRERERISERGEGRGQVVGVVGAGVDTNVNPNVPDPENLHGQEDDDEEELEEDYEGEDSEGEGVVPLPSLIDMSMCNAWFPGPIGGVKWVERDSIPVVNGRVNERGDEKEKGSIVERELDDSHEGDNEKKKQHHQERRREIVFNSGFEEPDAMKEDVCVRVREAALGLSPGSSASFMSSSSSSSTLSASDPFNDTAKAVLADMMKKKENNYTMRDGWVYETWDKEKVSVHDLGATATASSSSCHPAHVDSQENDAAKSKFNPHCATCVAFEQARREQRTREASKARKVLDRVMRRLGAGAGYQGMRMGVDSSEEGEEERGVNEDVDMEDLDMDSMAGFDKALEGVVRDAVKLGGGRGGMHVEDEDEEDRMEVDEGSVRVVYEDVVEDDDDYEEEEEEGYALAPPSSSPRDGNGRGRVEVFGDDESIDERGYWVHQTTTKRAKSSSKSGYSRASNGSAKTSTTPSSSSSSAADDERGQTPRPQSNSTSASSSSSSSSTTPPFTATTTSKYIQPIRRSYSRSRIGAGCNGGVGDIVVTGETATGDAYRTWQAPARFYGRVRKWDGLVGILRCAVSCLSFFPLSFPFLRRDRWD